MNMFNLIDEIELRHGNQPRPIITIPFIIITLTLGGIACFSIWNLIKILILR